MRNLLRIGWDKVTTSFWLWPILLTAVAVALALTALLVDLRWRDQAAPAFALPFLFGGGPAGARTALGTIANAMVSIAALVFSMTMVALSLASNQLGPRLMRVFVADRGNQRSLGLFLATFAYCIVGLSAIDDSEHRQFVPRLTVSVAFLLALIGLAVLIYFLHHVARAIQTPVVIASVARDIGRALSVAEAPAVDFGDGLAVLAPHRGYLQAVDERALVEVARRYGGVLELARGLGDFVYPGGLVARLRPPPQRDACAGAAAAVRAAVSIGPERTPVQDLAFQFDQLVEIGLRALSPGINDPITAIACLNHCAAGLAEFETAQLAQPVLRDREGHVRLLRPPETFAKYADLVFHPFRGHGAGQRMVALALLDVLGRLGAVVAPPHRALLREHAARVVEDAERLLANSGDRRDLALAHECTRRALEAP